MKNIKTTFDSFINEELSPKTYLNAADKLDRIGHKKRANELTKHSNNIINSNLSKLQPITITSVDEEFEVKPEYFNFEVIEQIDNENTGGSIHINWKIPGGEDDFIGQEIYFAVDFDVNQILDGPIIDGLLLDNRQSANKLVKLIKDIINIKVSEYPSLELVLPYLKVNNFYKD